MKIGDKVFNNAGIIIKKDQTKKEEDTNTKIINNSKKSKTDNYQFNNKGSHEIKDKETERKGNYIWW